jgi:hypothetical protein
MDEQDEFDEELIEDELIDDDEDGASIDLDGDGEGDDIDHDHDGEDDDGDDADDEDDDDDEPAEFRAALLAKQEMLALLSLRMAARGGRIVRVDPRQPLPAAKFYEDPAEAQRWFRRSLATSRRNGWIVFYDGEPLFG